MYVRPSKVMEKVGSVAYKLEFPQELSKVHNTFHVSNLKKCYADEPLAVPLDGLHFDDKLQFVKEPVEIVDREVKWLKRSRIPLIKVRWNSKRGPEFTWEREDQFKKKYPHLFTKTAPSSSAASISKHEVQGYNVVYDWIDNQALKDFVALTFCITDGLETSVLYTMQHNWHKLKKNQEVHLHYIKRLKENVETLREIVEDAKVERPLDTSLAYACYYTKHSQELLEYVIGTCPKGFGSRDKQNASTNSLRKKGVTFFKPCETSTHNTPPQVKHHKINSTNVPGITSTGVKGASAASRSKPRSNTKKDRTLSAKSALKQVEAHSRMKSRMRNTRIVLILVLAISVLSTALKSDCLPADPQEPIAPVVQIVLRVKSRERELHSTTISITHILKIQQNLSHFIINNHSFIMSTPVNTSSTDSQMHNNIMAAGSKDRPPMLGPGRYSQWRSRFLRYIDTKNNGEGLKKCILNGPYVPTSVLIQQHTAIETVLNMTPENKEHFQSEKEAIFLLLTGIGDEIYSTVDACNTANEMWIAIERLQQGESLNVQDVKTNLFWEFGKFTSSMMENPWSRITHASTRMVKILYYQAPKPQRSNATSSSTRQSASTRHKGKEVAKPITPQSESVSEEDSDPEQAQRDKECNKEFSALLAKTRMKDTTPSYTNDNQSGHFGDQRTMTVAGVGKQEAVSYMAKIQEVSPEESSSTGQPLEQVQNHDESNVFANVRRHSEQPESINDTDVLEKDDSNVIPESSNICTNDNQVDQNAAECVDERAALANSCLIALQNKQNEFEKYKAFNDRTIDYEILQTKLNETPGLLALKDIE
ncbi:hypothetical protein Tco_0845444, partial [Tanacetum coccineum]